MFRLYKKNSNQVQILLPISQNQFRVRKGLLFLPKVLIIFIQVISKRFKNYVGSTIFFWFVTRFRLVLEERENFLVSSMNKLNLIWFVWENLSVVDLCLFQQYLPTTTLWITFSLDNMDQHLVETHLLQELPQLQLMLFFKINFVKILQKWEKFSWITWKRSLIQMGKMESILKKLEVLDCF